MSLYLVETVTIFKHQYVIEANDPTHAEDTVTMQEAIELDQKCLDEVITTTREITKAEFFRLSDEAMNGHLGERIIHTVDYSKQERPVYENNLDEIGI